MKTLNLSRKELSVIRLALSQYLLNLRFDEMSTLRVGMANDKIHLQIVFASSLLSKL